MLPRNLHPRDAEARPLFRLLFALMVAAMVVMLLAASLPLLAEPGPAAIRCQPGKLLCEVGRALLALVPSMAQRTVLGATGLIVASGMSCIAILSWTGLRRKRG